MEHAQWFRNKAILLTHFSSRYKIEVYVHCPDNIHPSLIPLVTTQLNYKQILVFAGYPASSIKAATKIVSEGCCSHRGLQISILILHFVLAVNCLSCDILITDT